MSQPGRPPRAPALYVSGCLPGSTLEFRLPLPPSWAGRPPTARAAERRARKAYFAALDALHLGCVNEEAVGKLQRLVADLRAGGANRALEHLLRVFAFARRTVRPALLAPSEPMAHVTVGVPAELWTADRARLAASLAWPLEWMRMRRYVAGTGLLIDWSPLATVAAPEAPSRPMARLPHRRRHAGAA